MKTAYMQVTPEMAKEWLLHNTNNRNIKNPRVAQYARDMANGNWEADSPNPIIFGEDGTLKDGQHRLTAQVKANVDIYYLVCWVNNDVKNIDTGATRTVRDYFRMEGRADIQSATLAAINLKITKNKKITPSRAEIENEYLQDSENWDDAFRLSQIGKHNPIGRKGCVALAICNALKAGVSKETLTRFCVVLNSGLSDGRHENAAILARNTLLDMSGRTGSRSIQWRTCGIFEEYIHLFVNKSERVKKIKEPTWYYTKQLEEGNHGI